MDNIYYDDSSVSTVRGILPYKLFHSNYYTNGNRVRKRARAHAPTQAKF